MIAVPENPTGPGDYAELNARLYETRAARERVVEGYQTGPLSLHTLAEGLGGTVIGAIGNLAAAPDLRVRSWSDGGEGLLEAFAAAKTASTLVLDLSALGTLLILDAVDLLAEFSLPLVVARAALDLVREQAREAEARAAQASTTGGGTLAPTPLGPLAEALAPAVAAERAGRWRALAEALERHTIPESGLPLAAIPAVQRRSLVDIFGQVGAETMALARRPGRVLWTDDWSMGWLGRDELGLTAAWTQPVLARLINEGLLDPARYRRAILRLNACGYSWTLLDDGDFALALRDAAWDIDRQPLAAAIDWLGTPILTPVGSARLVGALLVKLWREAPTGQHAARATRRICNRLLRRSEGRLILSALYRNLDIFFGLDVLHAEDARQAIVDLLRAGPQNLQLPLPERYWNLGGG